MVSIISCGILSFTEGELFRVVVVRGSCRIRTNWHFHETTQALPLLHHNEVDDNDGDQDCGDDNDDKD